VVGVDKAFIGISTRTLNILNDDEIDGILAHELAHIKSDHVLYKTAARIMGSIVEVVASSTFGIGGLVSLPILYALKYWDRCSELSADRAELLTVRDFDTFVSTHMKLQSGVHNYKDEFDIKEFEKQAEEVYSLEKENFMDKVMKLFQELDQSHPFPVLRVGSIKEWLSKDNYFEILQGRYIKEDKFSTETEEEKFKEEIKEEIKEEYDKGYKEKTEEEIKPDPLKEFDKFVNDIKNFFNPKKSEEYQTEETEKNDNINENDEEKKEKKQPKNELDKIMKDIQDFLGF
ncbi:MAG: M48 family metallopeptidase, partial [Spirochaetota bacterium]